MGWSSIAKGTGPGRRRPREGTCATEDRPGTPRQSPALRQRLAAAGSTPSAWGPFRRCVRSRKGLLRCRCWHRRRFSRSTLASCRSISAAVPISLAPRGPDAEGPPPAARHLVRWEEYSPSLRSRAPSSPGPHRSAWLYAAVNRRHPAADTSGSDSACPPRPDPRRGPAFRGTPLSLSAFGSAAPTDGNAPCLFAASRSSGSRVCSRGWYARAAEAPRLPRCPMLDTGKWTRWAGVDKQLAAVRGSITQLSSRPRWSWRYGAGRRP
jgi:hypothetical protein